MTDTTRKRRRRGRPRGQEVDGERLRAWRRERGLTLAATAEQLGLSERTLRTVEHGGPVSVGTIRQVAEHCDIPYHMLVDTAEAPRSDRLLSFGFAPPGPPTHGAPRTDLVEAVSADLLASPGVVAIGGRSGIGKTWIARQVAAEVADDFADRVVWVTGASLQSPRHRIELQQRLADALGFADTLPRHDLVGEDAFHRAFCARFWRERRLLVIDDLPSTRACRHFVALDGVDDAEPHVLVTTRYRHVAGAWAPRVHLVPGLDDGAARVLLGENIDADRMQRDDRAVQSLLRLFAGVPRALHIAGRMLGREPYTPVGDFLKRVRDEPNALLPRTMTDDWGRDEASEVRRHGLFELHLSPDARALHSSLAIFGGRSFTLRWAAAAHGVDDAFTRRALSELADVFLLEEEKSGSAANGGSTRFRLDRHSLLTARARGTSAIRAARRRLVRFAESELEAILGLPDEATSRAWLTAEGGFATALDRACAPVLSAVPGSLRRPAPRTVATSAPFDSTTERVARMALALGRLMNGVALPNSPPWFLTGWLDAVHRSDDDAASRIATLAARQAVSEGRFEHAIGWIDAALEDTRAPHERESLDAWAARLLALNGDLDAAMERVDRHPRPHSDRSAHALGCARVTVRVIAGQIDDVGALLDGLEDDACARVSSRLLSDRTPAIEDIGALARRTDPLSAACLFSTRSRDASAIAQPRALLAHARARGGAGPAALLAQPGDAAWFVLRAADPPRDEANAPPLTAVSASSAEIGPVIVPAAAVRHALGPDPAAMLDAAAANAAEAAQRRHRFVSQLTGRRSAPSE